MQYTKKLKLVTSVFIGSMLLHASAYAEEALWTAEGFEQPESIVYHPAGDHYLISNINGAPDEQNNQGYISRLSATGEIIDKKWITGLNAPKGMAIVDNTLVVTDINRVHIIDLEQGKIMQTHTIENAKFLNDVSAGRDGTFYVTDMMDHAIYKLDNSGINLFLKNEALQHPNGVLFDEDKLYIGSWGVGIKDDFSTDVLGSVLTVNLESKHIETVSAAKEAGNIDGVTKINGEIVFNHWMTGDVFAISGNELKKIASSKIGLSDIGANGNTLLMPFMMDGTVEARSH